MTPEREERIEAKVDGLTEAVLQLTEHTLKSNERINRLERGFATLKSWARRAIDGAQGPRERLPSIGPDDSGSIEARAFGMGLKASGVWPVRFAILVIGLAAIVGCVVASRY